MSAIEGKTGHPASGIKGPQMTHRKDTLILVRRQQLSDFLHWQGELKCRAGASVGAGIERPAVRLHD
jgi:hypothetical protein